ncbi:hypothetical protein B0H17DRAFT_1217623 [Mycena rosella]|uniref:Uncharacterized protein n=1 Tax=Mycena rosella TaxID=1033263 RepID=A0AAD7BVH5_MYCRO|nr:hypothetical protein B0H17DRAFT_1217623 [Mycena rosella]
MSGPKTTWADLANLGWSKQQAYDRFNAHRGGTMKGLGDIAMNEGFANDWGWHAYNGLAGSPRIAGQTVDNIESSSIVFTYDNTANLQEVRRVLDRDVDQYRSLSAISFARFAHAASVPKAGISLGQKIDIPGVGGSEFSIEISTDSTKEETRENSHTLSTTWPIIVMGGEHVSIERIRIVSTGQTIYHQDYGVMDNSLVATKGKM